MELINASQAQKLQKTTSPEPLSSLTQELNLEPKKAKLAIQSSALILPRKLIEVFNRGNELRRTAIHYDLSFDKECREIDGKRLSARKTIDDDLTKLDQAKWSSLSPRNLDKREVPTGILAEFSETLFKNPEIGEALNEFLNSLFLKQSDNRFNSLKYIEKILQFVSDPHNAHKNFQRGLIRDKMDLLVDQLKPIGNNAIFIYVLSSLHSLIAYRKTQSGIANRLQNDFIAKQNYTYDTRHRFIKTESQLNYYRKRYTKLKKKHPNSEETKALEKSIQKAQAEYEVALKYLNNAVATEKDYSDNSDEANTLNSLLISGVLDQINEYKNIFHDLSELLGKIRTDQFQNESSFIEAIDKLRNASLPPKTQAQKTTPPTINKSENRFMHWLHGDKDRGLAMISLSLIILTGSLSAIDPSDDAGSNSTLLAAPTDKNLNDRAIATQTAVALSNKNIELPKVTPTPDAKSDFDRLVLPENKGTFLEQSKNALWSMFTGHSIFIPENGPTMKPDQIDYVLDTYNKSVGREDSPAAGLGLGQFIYERCIFYNIDPAIILGIFNKESGLGTMGMAKITDNVANVRSLDMFGNKITDLISDEMNAKFGFTIHYENNNGYADYFAVTHDKKTAYMMSIEHELRTLYEYYINNTDGSGNPMPRNTIESVIEKFAPRSENDTDKYIKDLIDFTNYFRYTYGIYSREDVTHVEPSGNPLGNAEFIIMQSFNGEKSHIQLDSHGHQVGGVDLIRADGNTFRAPVSATSSGVFRKVPNPDTTYGDLAITEYFDPHSLILFDTLNAHMDEYNSDLKDGQWIQKGTLLGYIGYTGWVDPPGINGSHLHYSQYKTTFDGNVIAVDPEPSLYVNR